MRRSIARKTERLATLSGLSVSGRRAVELLAGDGNQLKRLRRESHFILVTLIQKFRMGQPGQHYKSSRRAPASWLSSTRATAHRTVSWFALCAKALPRGR